MDQKISFTATLLTFRHLQLTHCLNENDCEVNLHENKSSELIPDEFYEKSKRYGISMVQSCLNWSAEIELNPSLKYNSLNQLNLCLNNAINVSNTNVDIPSDTEIFKDNL